MGSPNGGTTGISMARRLLGLYSFGNSSIKSPQLYRESKTAPPKEDISPGNNGTTSEGRHRLRPQIPAITPKPWWDPSGSKYLLGPRLRRCRYAQLPANGRNPYRDTKPNPLAPNGRIRKTFRNAKRNGSKTPTGVASISRMSSAANTSGKLRSTPG